MGLLSSLLSSFAEGFRKGLENTDVKEPKGKLKNAYINDRELEIRIYRARTENLEIVNYCDVEHRTAKVYNAESGRTYYVSDTKCECEDFCKRRKPCKHMIFLAIKNETFKKYEKPVPYRTDQNLTNPDGAFVPAYWDYYSGEPTGIGYLNLYTYEISGRLHGVSAKTGQQTNRKKIIFVNARNVEDAIKAAEELNVMPPYEYITLIDTPPSERQYAYLHGAGIPAPYFITERDIGALLTRYQDGDDCFCPQSLMDLATRRRVSVSLFDAPKFVAACIWRYTPDEQKPALFCYAVLCQELGYMYGHGPISEKDPVFQGFDPEKKRLQYILSQRSVGYEKLSPRSYAYMDAIAYIKRERPDLFQ